MGESLSAHTAWRLGHRYTHRKYDTQRNQDPLREECPLEAWDQKIGKESVTQILHMQYFVKLSEEKYILKYKNSDPFIISPYTIMWKECVKLPSHLRGSSERHLLPNRNSTPASGEEGTTQEGPPNTQVLKHTFCHGCTGLKELGTSGTALRETGLNMELEFHGSSLFICHTSN